MLPNFQHVLPNYTTKTALVNSDEFTRCVSAKAVKAESVTCQKYLDGRVVVLDGLLSTEECARLTATVDACSQLSFWSQAGRDNDEARAFRNADTVEVCDEALAGLLWERSKHLLEVPERVICIPEDEEEVSSSTWSWERELPGKWLPAGFNHDLLFAKYPPEGSFAPHTDGRAIRDFNCRSFESVIVFLESIPDGCGGGTRFYQDKALQSLVLDSSGSQRWTADPSLVTLEVLPKAGRALLFDQSLVHEGVPPSYPHTKHIIRSDIMYEREDPICCEPVDKMAYSIFRQAEALAEEGKVTESLSHFQKAWRLSPTLARIQGQR